MRVGAGVRDGTCVGVAVGDCLDEGVRVATGVEVATGCEITARVAVGLGLIAAATVGTAVTPGFCATVVRVAVGAAVADGLIEAALVASLRGVMVATGFGVGGRRTLRGVGVGS
ncbi:MAG TPA: hypothetical protein VIL01_03555 [Thermomicrobiales bacterium]